MTDEQLIASIEDFSLPNDQFDHEAHVRAALYYLRDNALDVAITKMRALLKAYATHYKLKLYHETITWTFMLICHDRMLACGTAEFDDFAKANPDVMDYQNPIFLKYYTKEEIASERAKHAFMLPLGRMLP